MKEDLSTSYHNSFQKDVPNIIEQMIRLIGEAYEKGFDAGVRVGKVEKIKAEIERHKNSPHCTFSQRSLCIELLDYIDYLEDKPEVY